MAHLSSNIFFLVLLSLFSCSCLRSCSCLAFLSSSSFLLLSSSIFFDSFLSSVSFLILAKVSSIFSSQYFSFSTCCSCCCGGVLVFAVFLHFFQMFNLASLSSILLLFSSSAKRCLLSCSGSFFQVSVIFFCLILAKVSCCWVLAISNFLLLAACFFVSDCFLSSVSLFQHFSFSFRYLVHSLRSSQLCSFFSALSIRSALSLAIFFVSRTWFLNNSSQSCISTSTASP